MDSEVSGTVGADDAGGYHETAVTHTIPEAVGPMYDLLTEVLTVVHDGGLHMGYWDAEDGDEPGDDGHAAGPDEDSIVVAAARMTGELIRRLDVTAGQRVLDVGCGTGEPAVRLALAREVAVSGISLSDAEVAWARERARAAGVAGRVGFRRADVRELPWPDGTFDAAWAVESMPHIADRARALGEIARVLRPGGRLVLLDGYLRETVGDAERARMTALLHELRCVFPETGEEHRRLLAAAGFRVTAFDDVTGYTRESTAMFADVARLAAASSGRVDVRAAMDRFAAALEGTRTLTALGSVIVTAERTDRPPRTDTPS